MTAELNAEKESINMNLYEHLMEMKEDISYIKAKVDIHNNYEKRFETVSDDVKTVQGDVKDIQKNQWKIMGIYTGVLSVIAIILLVVAKIT